MVVNFEGSVVNLRDKLMAVDRKKTQSDGSQNVQDNGRSEKNNDNEKQYIADVIGIRNENRLAVVSNSSIQSQEEALDMIAELKRQFADDPENAINAHKKSESRRSYAVLSI